MDEIVKAALKKWPNVPACRGWLALDARGNWYMRDDRVQAAGPFPRVKGSRIRARQAARIHPSQLRARRRRRLVLPERPSARVCRARGRAVRLARRPTRLRTHKPQRPAGSGAQHLARRIGPIVPRRRHRFRPRAHAGHARGRASRRSRSLDARTAGLRGHAGTLRLRAQSATSLGCANTLGLRTARCWRARVDTQRKSRPAGRLGEDCCAGAT